MNKTNLYGVVMRLCHIKKNLLRCLSVSKQTIPFNASLQQLLHHWHYSQHGDWQLSVQVTDLLCLIMYSGWSLKLGRYLHRKPFWFKCISPRFDDKIIALNCKIVMCTGWIKKWYIIKYFLNILDRNCTSKKLCHLQE